MGNIIKQNETNQFSNLILQKVIFIQKFWRRKKVKNKAYKKQSMTSSIEGVEISNLDQKTLTTSQLQETEKRLGPFSVFSNNIVSNKNLIYKQILYHNNTIYLGTLNSKTLKKEGRGILYGEDQSKYIGEFQNDLPNGIGRLLFNDGSYYEGMLKDGKQNGYGKYEFENYIYIGNWVNDMREGKGEEQFKDGSFFKGNFHLDQKKGLGILIYPNGKSIEGYFNSENTINGICRMKFEDNSKVSLGLWEQGVMKGINLFYWDNNQKYIGEYVNFVKNGFGIFCWEDHSIYVGYWINGKQHGYGFMRELTEEDENENLLNNGNLYEWRYGIEINKIGENSDKYYHIFHEIKEKVEKIKEFCKNNFQIESILDKQFNQKIINYRFFEK